MTEPSHAEIMKNVQTVIFSIVWLPPEVEKRTYIGSIYSYSQYTGMIDRVVYVQVDSGLLKNTTNELFLHTLLKSNCALSFLATVSKP